MTLTSGGQRYAGAAIVYVGIAGNLFIALSPVFWGGFSHYLGLSDSRIGEIMSAEFFGATLATVTGILYMYRPQVNLRQLAFVSLAVYALGNGLTPFAFSHPKWLLGIRFVCGLSTGTTYLAAATAITALGNPARLVAVFYGTPYIAGVVLQPLMHPVFERWGFGAAFEVMAVAAVGSLSVYAFFPQHCSEDSEHEPVLDSATPALTLLLILASALLIQYIANSGIWLFFERIGTLSGHSEQTAATIVGLGTGVALLGTALSTVLAGKLAPVWAILSGTIVLVVSSLTLHFAANLAIYIGSVTVFNAMTTFLTPFYIMLMVDIFVPAKAVIVGNICMMLGFALGPLLIGYTARGNGFALSINATVGLFVVSGALVVAFALLVQPNRRKTGGYAGSPPRSA